MYLLFTLSLVFFWNASAGLLHSAPLHWGGVVGPRCEDNRLTFQPWEGSTWYFALSVALEPPGTIADARTGFASALRCLALANRPGVPCNCSWY